MKRIVAFLLALPMVLALTACGDGTVETSSTPTPQPRDMFVFVYKGCELPMNAEFAPLLETIGEPDTYFEAASCAFDGLDKIYTYGGIELTTYPDGDKDYISSIRLLDNTASTPEGITIGSTTEEVVAAYGNEYTDSGDLYTWENDNAILSILFDNGVAISVEYIALNDLLV